MRYLLILILPLILIASKCEKEEPVLPPNTSGNQDLRTVKVVVKHYYQIQPTRKDSVVPGVEVRLFRTKYDRTHDMNVDGVQTTNATGTATFKGRDDSLYFVRSAHPKLGVKEDDVTAPSGTISYLEIWYY